MSLFGNNNSPKFKVGNCTQTNNISNSSQNNSANQSNSSGDNISQNKYNNIAGSGFLKQIQDFQQNQMRINNNNNNNIFQNKNNEGTNNISNINNNQTNNNMNINNSFGNMELGSNRGKYEIKKSIHGECNGYQGIIQMDTNIMYCIPNQKLNLTLLRLEDYYLIRSQKLTDENKQKIMNAIKQNGFNEKFIQNVPQNFQPPNISVLNEDIGSVQYQNLRFANNINNSDNTNNNNNSNNNMNINNSFGNMELGSNRGKYEIKKSIHEGWDGNNFMNTNIMYCIPNQKLNLTLLRLEDYYLIRSQKLTDENKQKIMNAIKQNGFNEKFIQNVPQNFQPPNISVLNEDIGSVQYQNLRFANNINNSDNTNNNNSNNNIFRNNILSSRNIFQTLNNSHSTQSSNNIINNNNGNIIKNNNSCNGSNTIQNNNTQSIFQNQISNINSTSNNKNIFNHNSIFGNKDFGINVSNNNVNKSDLFNNNSIQQNIFQNNQVNNGSTNQNFCSINTMNNHKNIFGDNFTSNLNNNAGNKNINSSNINTADDRFKSNNNIKCGSNFINPLIKNENSRIFSNNHSIFSNNNCMFTNNHNILSNRCGNNVNPSFKNDNCGIFPNNIFNNNNIFSNNNNNIFTNNHNIFSNSQNNFLKNNPQIVNKTTDSIFNNQNNRENTSKSIFNNDVGNKTNNVLFNNNQSKGINIFKDQSNIFNRNDNINKIFRNNVVNNNIIQQVATNTQQSTQSEIYYAPAFPINEYTLEQYLEMKEKEEEDKKNIKQSYFMPSACPEECAPSFKKKTQNKPIYININEDKCLNSKLFSSEISTQKNSASLPISSSIQLNNQKKEEININNQSTDSIKPQENNIRQQISQLMPLNIKIEAICCVLDGQEEVVILDDQIKTNSQVKQIGLSCKDYLLQKGSMKESACPYFFQIYYNGVLIKDQDQLINDFLLISERLFKCEVIFEFDRHPFMNTSDYIISPSLEVLQKLPIKDLKNIKDFSVEGNFGKLQWLEPVDLTGLDIDKTIQIRDQLIQVYPDVEFNNQPKTNVGEGINKKCQITYKNASTILRKISQGDLNFKVLVKCIKKQCIDQNAKFVTFDESNKTWTIQVEHFSKYEFDLEQEEEEGQEAENQEKTNPQSSFYYQNNRGGLANHIQQQYFINQETERERIIPNQYGGQSQNNSFKMNYIPYNENSETNINPNMNIESSTFNQQKNFNIIQQNRVNNFDNRNSFLQSNSIQSLNANSGHNYFPQQYKSQQNTQIQTQKQYPYTYGGNMDPVQEEIENVSQNNTYTEMESYTENNQRNKNIPNKSQQQYLNNQYYQEQLQQQNKQIEQDETQYISKQPKLDNFEEFNNIVQSRMQKINEKQNQVPKVNALLPQLKKHEKVSRGLQSLNQCLYQHSMKEYINQKKDIYHDFSFCSSWNQTGFISYSSSQKTIRQHTFQQNNIGRIITNQRESIDNYNRVVINGFIQSIIESQSQDKINSLNNLVKNFQTDDNSSENQIWSQLPQFTIPINNQYTLFLILYFKNHILPALSQTENDNKQTDLYQALMDELNILSLINILFGNPKVDIISILSKVNNMFNYIFENLNILK